MTKIVVSLRSVFFLLIESTEYHNFRQFGIFLDNDFFHLRNILT